MSKKRGTAYQIKSMIDAKMRIGESKHEAKGTEEGISGKIFSYETRRTYIKQANHFINWCKTQGYRHDTITQYKRYVPEYLRMMVDRHNGKTLSASTIKTRASALGKIYGCSIYAWGVDLPIRHRADIKRSRFDTVRDRHFSEVKHADFVTFCKSTGLRRCELERLTGDQFRMIDGRAYITGIVGKGGKIRNAEVIGNVNLVRKLCQRANGGRVFTNVYKTADVHGYRAEYAASVYKRYARAYIVCKHLPFYNKEKYNGAGGKKGGFDRNSIYRFRDGSGRWLDKKAMLRASINLGHERISVVGEHYLYRL